MEEASFRSMFAEPVAEDAAFLDEDSAGKLDGNRLQASRRSI